MGVRLTKLAPRLGACVACKGAVSSHAETCPGCGQPEPYLPDMVDVRALVDGGLTINAVLAVRIMEGCTLEHAKAVVDGLRAEAARGEGDKEA